MTLSDRQAVEVFHLLFMRTLLVGSEKALVVLKGGCNLRFYFGSPRYSEDIDFDVRTIAPGTLRKNVDKVLAPGALLDRQLRAHGLGLGTVSSPKQTDTTQRWKVGLTTAVGAELHTKIEFSRRDEDGDSQLDAVVPSLLERYRLPPI